MKALLIMLLLLVVFPAGCAPDIPHAAPAIRLHDRDVSKLMFADTIHTQFVEDVSRTVWEWQQSHPRAEILSVGVSVGFKVIGVTIVYQQSGGDKGVKT